VPKLEFDLSAEDFAAFSLDRALYSETGLAGLRRARVNTTVACLVVSVLIVELLSRNLVAGLVIAGVSAVTVWFVFPWSWQRAAVTNVKQLAASGALGKPGKRLLTADDTGLIETGAGPTMSAHWDDVERVESTPEHVFVYVRDGEAFIVPKRVGEPQIGAFLAEIEARRAKG